MNGSDEESTHRAIERVARESYGRLVAYLSSHTRDVASAEDALSNALVAALTAWPRDGVPQNPEAWLLTAARRSLSILCVIGESLKRVSLLSNC
jgi:predicted RNA polymerase sigma factor